MDQKTLTTIAQDQLPPAQVSANMADYDRLNQLPAHHILNVIKSLKEKQMRQSIWFDFTLPSN
jgi:hypothetical protein